MTETKKPDHIKFLALNLASDASNEEIAEAILAWARKNTEEASKACPEEDHDTE